MAFLEQPQRILLPVSPAYMAFTFALALLFNLLPWPDVAWLPDALSLVLAFWCVHQPRKVGIGVAWFLGLVMDAGSGALLGQHAFAYAVLAFAAAGLHRRILWFSLWQQAVHVLILLLACQALMLVTRLVVGDVFPGFAYFGGSFFAAALWPTVTFILLLPQRRPESVDRNRPI